MAELRRNFGTTIIRIGEPSLVKEDHHRISANGDRDGAIGRAIPAFCFAALAWG
jgi:hypothetical protein